MSASFDARKQEILATVSGMSIAPEDVASPEVLENRAREYLQTRADALGMTLDQLIAELKKVAKQHNEEGMN